MDAKFWRHINGMLQHQLSVTLATRMFRQVNAHLYRAIVSGPAVKRRKTDPSHQLRAIIHHPQGTMLRIVRQKPGLPAFLGHRRSVCRYHPARYGAVINLNDLW